jgi:hypothetical protein
MIGSSMSAKRIELVIVALCATSREPQPHGANRADTIGQHPRFVVLWLRATLGRGEEKPIESRADASILRGIWQQVPGHLLFCEAIKSLVFVKCANDPIAVRPNVLWLIAVIANRVGEAHDIEPTQRHSLAIVRVLHHAVDQPFISTWCPIVDKRRHFFRRRRNTQEIKIQTANQCAAIRLGRRPEPNLRQALSHEHIDAVLPSGHLGLNRRFERPMLLVSGALGNPSVKDLLLSWSEFLMRVGRRHNFIGFGRRDAARQLTIRRLARYDWRRAGLRRFDCVVAQVQPQLGLASVVVRTVAMKAVVRKDRSHVAIEFNSRQRRKLESRRQSIRCAKSKQKGGSC